MKETILKVSRIGNSRGVRLPARMLKMYQITVSVIVEEGIDEINLRPYRRHDDTLSWEDTYKAMAEESEDWSEWDATSGDGLGEIPWEEPPPESSPKKTKPRRKR